MYRRTSAAKKTPMERRRRSMSLLPTIHLFLVASSNPSSRFCICPERPIDENTPFFPFLFSSFPYTVLSLRFVLFFGCFPLSACSMFFDFVLLFFLSFGVSETRPHTTTSISKRRDGFPRAKGKVRYGISAVHAQKGAVSASQECLCMRHR